MSFERVRKTGGNTHETPQLAVYTQLKGRFNKTATEQFFKDVDCVEFYVDIESNRLGIARGGTGPDAYTVRDSGIGASVTLRSALGKFGIQAGDIDESVRLPLEQDPDEGLLVADLAPLLEEVRES